MLVAAKKASEQLSKRVAGAAAHPVAKKKLPKHPDTSGGSPPVLVPILRSIKPGTEGANSVVPYAILKA